MSAKADEVAALIHDLADILRRDLDTAVARDIANELGQRDITQGLRMGCCIWLTSLRMQNLLASSSDTLRQKGLQSTQQLQEASGIGGIINPSDVRREWARILEVNYGVIFNSARAALDARIPDAVSAHVLGELSRKATEITALRLGSRVDFAGELFPKLLDDREETAAHYTLPETAELLAQLAVSRIDFPNWSSSPDVAGLRLADMACGTGSLLRAAYTALRRRHEAAGGSGENLHKTMMEESITGLDINSLASHMTAAGLSLTELETEYHHTNVAAVPIAGGKVGSLELLTAEQITDVTGELARAATATDAQPTSVIVPEASQDLVIQNPPYSRARGDRKLFDVTGINEMQRKRSVRRLANIRNQLRRTGDEMTDGQAGLGSDFSALALHKLKPGGVFATVLPLTAAHAESWEGFRRTIERECRQVTAIAFTSNETYRTAPEERQQDSVMLSADTHMSEMLLVAVKRNADNPDDSGTPLLCVNLNQYPQSVAEAYWIAKLVKEIDELPGDSDVINISGHTVGSWTRTTTPRAGFPWFAVGMRDHYLVETANRLMAGRLYSPGDMQEWELGLPFTTLGELVAIGPTHHLIGHPRDARERIGAFTFDSIGEGEIPVYPSLWRANADAQRSFVVLPTHSGHPVAGRDNQQRQMLDARGDLFISRTLWMVTQALAAARTEQPTLGGRAWTVLLSDDEAIKAALSIWLNSTLGLMLRTCYAQTTQPGRATMQINALGGFLVPDFAANSAGGTRARSVAIRHYKEVSELPLQPVAYAFRDNNRERLDAICLAMLGLGENPEAANAVSNLRMHWCREPSVHGGVRSLLEALNLTRPAD